MTLRVGVIGCGRMGLKHIQAYREAGCEVLCVCDPDEDRISEAIEAGALMGCPDDEYQFICEDEDISLISIATPDQTHAEIAISALQHGKHVFVEKPAATSSAELEALREAYSASGGHLSSNLCLRTNPEMQWLRQGIQAGHLGTVEVFMGQYIHNLGDRLKTGWRATNYSPMHGGGIHLADLAHWLAPDAHHIIDAYLDEEDEPDAHSIWLRHDRGEYVSGSWLAHDSTALIHQFVDILQHPRADWPDTLPTAEEVFRGVEICNQIVEGEG